VAQPWGEEVKAAVFERPVIDPLPRYEHLFRKSLKQGPTILPFGHAPNVLGEYLPQSCPLPDASLFQNLIERFEHDGSIASRGQCIGSVAEGSIFSVEARKFGAHEAQEAPDPLAAPAQLMDRLVEIIARPAIGQRGIDLLCRYPADLTANLAGSTEREAHLAL
jgi:hypothetical protein